jgi:Ca2+-transporting ATPase
MKRHPRRRSERITDRSFLRTMGLTGFLTAGVAFTVYLYVLKSGTPEKARTCAFAVLVFAELLRSFGGRSETKPVWRISFFTNINLAIVVSVSFALQVRSQHNATLGRFLKSSFIPLTDCLGLLAVGTIPLVVLEMVKLVRNKRRRAASAG